MDLLDTNQVTSVARAQSYAIYLECEPNVHVHTSPKISRVPCYAAGPFHVRTHPVKSRKAYPAARLARETDPIKHHSSPHCPLVLYHPRRPQCSAQMNLDELSRPEKRMSETQNGLNTEGLRSPASPLCGSPPVGLGENARREQTLSCMH